MLRYIGAVACGLLAAVGVSCSGSDGQDAATTTTTEELPPITMPATSATSSTTTASTTTTERPEAAVERAVFDFFETYRVVNQPPDPNHPLLETVAEPMRGVLTDDLRSEVAAGISVEVPDPSVAHQVILSSEIVSSTEAQVVLCNTNDFIFRTKDGEIIDDSVLRIMDRVILRRDSPDGPWMVSEVLEGKEVESCEDL